MNRHLVEGRGIVLREVLMRGDEAAILHAVDRWHASAIKFGELIDAAVRFGVINEHIILPWATLTLWWRASFLCRAFREGHEGIEQKILR